MDPLNDSVIIGKDVLTNHIQKSCLEYDLTVSMIWGVYCIWNFIPPPRTRIIFLILVLYSYSLDIYMYDYDMGLVCDVYPPTISAALYLFPLDDAVCSHDFTIFPPHTSLGEISRLYDNIA